jgi:hypothetical protein
LIHHCPAIKIDETILSRTGKIEKLDSPISYLMKLICKPLIYIRKIQFLEERKRAAALIE